MNSYETVVIINNNLKQKEIKDEIEKIQKNINEIGEVTKVEDIGERKLAYEVKKHKEGYYCAFEFNSEGSKISELERFYRLEDNILKFLVARKENQI